MITGGLPTIYVTDIDRAVKFYTDILGLKLDYQAGPDWAQLDAGNGLSLGLHGTHPGGSVAGQSGSISVGFRLDEPLDGAYERLRHQGVQFHGPINEGGEVRLAPFGDPDGNSLYLYEEKSRSA